MYLKYTKSKFATLIVVLNIAKIYNTNFKIYYTEQLRIIEKISFKFSVSYIHISYYFANHLAIFFYFQNSFNLQLRKLYS